MTEVPITDRRLQLAVLISTAVVAAEFVLLLAAVAFFRAMNADIPDNLLADLLPDPADPRLHGEALHARLAWMASVAFALFASAVAIILAATKILKELEPLRRRMLYVLAVLVLLAASVATVSDVSLEVLRRPLLEPTLERYQVGSIAVTTTFAYIRRLVNALFAAAAVAVVLALLTRSCLGPTMAATRGAELSLKERFADLHVLLIAAAAMLVSIVITMAAWLAWPTAGLAKDSDGFHLVAEIARGVGSYWGTVFTLILVLAYLPCVGYLRHIAATSQDPAAAGAGGQEVKLLQDAVALLSPFISALLPVFLI